MPEHRFHTPEPVELAVSIPSGEVIVETTHGDESIVVVEGSEKLVEQTTVALHGNQLVVQYRGAKAFGITIEIAGFIIGNEKLRVHAQIPHASAATFATASADMRVEGTLSTLETKTASGDLYVRGTVNGNATVKTVSGDVYLDEVAGDLSVNSVSGDIRADEIRGTVRTKSVSGDVRIGSARGGEATLQSVSGDIVVGVAAGTNVDVDANSVSGDLDSEVPLGSDIGAGLGEGPTLVVRGKTVSGDFRLVRAS
jgi:Putative adhesin